MTVPGPVAWLTGEYPRATDTFIQREVAALREAGLDVIPVSIRRTGAHHHVGPEQRAEAARTVQVLEAARRPGSLLAHLRALRRPRSYLGAWAAAWSTAVPGLRGRLYGLIYLHEAVVLAGMLRGRGVVHLHVHIAMGAATVARLAAPLAGIPWSLTLHGPDDLAEPARWRLGDKLARAAFTCCISAFCRSQAMLHAPREAWERLHVVHCGVEPARYDRPRAPRPGALLFVGRLAAAKGVPALLAAVSRARAERPDLTLTLVGDGLERLAIEAEARALGLGDAISFLGYKGQEEVAAMLATHAALVLPSFAEGLPVVLMEALAAGTPVVATRIAGIPELVEDGRTGRLVPPGDEAALARAILDTLDDPGAAEAMASRGRDRVRAEFDSRREAGRLLHLLRHAREGGPRPSVRPEAA